MVVVSTTDHTSAYRIFSVLNAQGLDLSPTDIFKAQIIGEIQPSSQREYSRRWEQQENQLGRKNFGDLFSQIRMIFQKDKARKDLLEEFNEHVKPLEAPEKFVKDILIPYGDHFDAIRTQSWDRSDNSHQVNLHLRRLARLDNSDWEAPVLEAMKLYEQQPDTLCELISKIEKLAYSMFVQRTDITRRFKRYGRVLSQLSSYEKMYR